jgi:hypothetical protein
MGLRSMSNQNISIVINRLMLIERETTYNFGSKYEVLLFSPISYKVFQTVLCNRFD